jgi:hypothetical protein
MWLTFGIFFVERADVKSIRSIDLTPGRYQGRRVLLLVHLRTGEDDLVLDLAYRKRKNQKNFSRIFWSN